MLHRFSLYIKSIPLLLQLGGFMKMEKSDYFKLLHLIIGLFFTISGIITIGDKYFIYSIWIISGVIVLLMEFEILKGL